MQLFFFKHIQLSSYLHLIDFANIGALEERQYTSGVVIGPVLCIFFCTWPSGKKV